VLGPPLASCLDRDFGGSFLAVRHVAVRHVAPDRVATFDPVLAFFQEIALAAVV